ncbi:MAG TPA: hypothetical protein VKG26_00410 [Bacteroidia bacterium]|nr:hypothetical protein [Bacteroidia bacterium]
MKKAFTISVSVIVCLVIALACKKSNTTTTTTTTPPSSTTTAPTNTTTTNFTVDGTAAHNPFSTYNNSSGNYVVSGIDGSSQYPQIELVFSGTVTPVSGAYAVVNINGASPAASQCELILVTASGSFPASSGNVTVVAGSSSSAYFTNISCSYQGVTHVVTGNVKWP